MPNDPIAYTYEADTHCLRCTFARFGSDELGFPPEDARDREGNEIHPVAPWDEWWQTDEYPYKMLGCGTCGDTIATHYDPDAAHARYMGGSR